MKDFPDGHEFNHSFLGQFYDQASDGVYEGEITDEQLKEFGKAWFSLLK